MTNVPTNWETLCSWNKDGSLRDCNLLITLITVAFTMNLLGLSLAIIVLVILYRQPNKTQLFKRSTSKSSKCKKTDECEEVTKSVPLNKECDSSRCDFYRVSNSITPQPNDFDGDEDMNSIAVDSHIFSSKYE
ncbi:hypothetical protein EG68_00107 [Paragonimus skrjabini miyazakii]|uniref:Uncharacterized protein n=1 Tax=Paragonimus skrjabini miyazakii TaxID=59628 RepID=A0A8S9ZAU5_9TREM|nr:hypothetical protein EG68_00107 [Paragonimus skrjabini miyazakii]